MIQSKLDGQPQYLSIPLAGRTLLEASAGTGKTFTVALLYLRALLGMGTPNNKPLKVNEILVVTFTNAATEELIDRVRKRIKEALDFLEHPNDLNNDQALVKVLEQAQTVYKLSHGEIKGAFETALSEISFARISTIHSFCADLLSDVALDAGLPINMTLTTDGGVLDDAIKDVWRENIETPSTYFKGKLSKLENFKTFFKGMASKGKFNVDDGFKFNDIASEFYEKYDESTLIKAFSSTYDRDALEKFFIEYEGHLNQGTYSLQKKIKGLLDEIDSRLFDNRVIPKSIVDKFSVGEILKKINKPKLNDADKIKSQLEAIPFCVLCDDLAALLGSDPVEFIDKETFVASLRSLSSRIKYQESLTSELHSDRLIQLAAQASEQDEVANKLRKELPLAIIDEFQDTDPFQYQLFNNIYGSLNLEEEESSSGLIMVGDPKQAIYGFRGGDIYTYLKAKPNVSDEETVGENGLLEKQNQVELRTLTQNFRSTEQIVQGIEQIFLNRQQHSPEFEPFNHPKIPFIKVTAGADQSELIIEQNDHGKPLQAITGIYLDDNQDASLNAASKKSLVAEKSVEYIKKLLALSENGQCFFQKKSSNQRSKLKPSDICLLVNSHTEASLLKKALLEQNIPSLTQARNSVLKEQEAYDCWLVLKAILNPSDKHSVQEALLAKMSGLGHQGALAISSDEGLMRQCVNILHELNDVLKYKGPMVAIKRWLSLVGASARLMKVEHDRESTNINQVLELLQDEFCQVGGGLKLLTRFEQAMQSSEQTADERLIRLESDDDRAKIVTIHTSKGLEYPIVLLPFGWNDSIQNRGPLFSTHDEDGKAILGFADSVKKGKEKELRDEKLRLFYVALTRASHHIAVFFIDSGKHTKSRGAEPSLAYNQSPLAHFFPTKSAKISVAEAHQEFECAVSEANGNSIALDEVQEPITGTLDHVVNDENEATSNLRVFTGKVAQHIGVSSFSMLTRGYHLELKDQDEDSEVVADNQRSNLLSVPDRFTLAKGAHIGTALHNVLEHTHFARWKESEQEDKEQSLNRLLTRELKSNGVIRSDEALKGKLPAYLQWMTEVLQTPFHPVIHSVMDEGEPIALQDIESWFPELDFTFQMENSLSNKRLEALLEDHGDYAISGYKGIPIHGMLQGAIDLIFCHNDKYYLADYKSNHLGDSFDSYLPEKLSQSIQEKGYRLQFLIYSLALHLHLKQRKEDYQYEKHFGGVYYLYLRGMHPEHTKIEEGINTGVFYDLPPKALIEKLEHFFSKTDEMEGVL